MLARSLFLVFLLWPALSVAQDYPRPTSDTVNDAANLLPPDQEASLRARLKSVRKATGVQVVVATYPSRAGLGFAATALEPFATGLFNNWGIGDDKRNDGILILVLPGDREMRIELGSGYPAPFDKVAQEIVDTEFLPALRKGDYDKGIQTGTDAVIAHIARGFGQNGTSQPLYQPPGGGAVVFPLVALGAIGVVVAFVLSRTLLMFQRCPQCNRRGLQRTVVTLNQATEHASGREEVTTICPHCGHREVYSRSVPPRGSTRSSGTGGFGGGRSSGGGASGRW